MDGVDGGSADDRTTGSPGPCAVVARDGGIDRSPETIGPLLVGGSAMSGLIVSRIGYCHNATTL
jgi:hypothetical protein